MPLQKMLFWLFVIVLIGSLAYNFYYSNELCNERVSKDRIIKLYQESQSRVAEHQRTIEELTNKLKSSATTIEQLERAISGTNIIIGNANESVERSKTINRRMEEIIRGLPEGN